MRIILASALAALAVSCAATNSSVPVAGGAADLSQLAGDWNGDYHATSGGRQGLITFKLAAGADTARGDVLMFPSGRPSVGGPGETAGMGATAPRALSIAFVRADHGTVSGRLDPYRDPDCGCDVTTVFMGTIRGDTIEGEYVSHRSDDPAPVRGEWKVKRSKPR